MEEFVFWSWTMQFHYSKKSLFFTISWQKNVFFLFMKMTNHHDKQITPPESWDQDDCFEPGFRYHQLQIIGLEFFNAVATKSRWTLGQAHTENYTHIRWSHLELCNTVLLILFWKVLDKNIQWSVTHRDFIRQVQTETFVMCICLRPI